MTPGSKEWWIVVRSTQFLEAELMLKDYRAELVQLQSAHSTQENMAEITKVNEEIHRLSQIQNRANIARAVRNIFGDEGWARVREEAARLEYEVAGC